MNAIALITQLLVLLTQLVSLWGIWNVKKHTNSMKDALVAAAKKEGAQEEKDKQQ